MELELDGARWMQDTEGVWLCLRAVEPVQARRIAGQLAPYFAGQNTERQADKPRRYTARLLEARGKRSKDANAYLWALCQKIAEAVGHTTKEEVYKEAVRHAGQFEILPIRNDAAAAFVRKWQGRGTGWIAEKQDDSKLPGYSRMMAYYGSSVYDGREMAALLDYVIDEAKDIGVETATPEELARMKERWDDAQADKSG